MNIKLKRLKAEVIFHAAALKHVPFTTIGLFTGLKRKK